MSINLNLKLSSSPLNPSYLFNSWTNYNKKNKTGYVTLSNSLENYLPYIKSAAINLYIFYAIHAKNEEGYSYYSNETIARKLNVSQKTISNWNSTLQNLGLITRKSNANSSSTTYLLPLSDFIIELSSNYTTQYDNISKFLKNEGYITQNPIYLSVITSSSMNYVYNVFRKTYATDFNSKIIRNIYIERKQKNSKKYSLENEEFGWYENKDKHIIIIWNPKTDFEDSSTNRLEILTNLNSSEAIQAFKTNYPKASLSK